MTHAHTAISSSRLANEIARDIHCAFSKYHEGFRKITRRATERFSQRDWHALQCDALERLEVRDRELEQLLTRIRSVLAERLQSRLMWVGIKAVYSGLIANRDDWEIAETFFNSVTRRVFTTVGIDPEIEFVHTDYAAPPNSARALVYRSYHASGLSDLLCQVLSQYPSLCSENVCIKLEAKRITEHITSTAPSILELSRIDADFVHSIFYRGRNAYLMGRINTGSSWLPFVVCFTNESTPSVDAVLLEEDDVSLLFSFTRSYFLVDVQCPYDMVAFIQSLIPQKRVAEIYISLGYNKHGKTELYRHALCHLAESRDYYRLADGQRGMVMVVFQMPSYPVVFKVIRDEFEYPKDCTHKFVKDRYQLVFRHDRAGRLVDAQEYEYLVLDRRRFEEQLLYELHDKAQETVEVQGNNVVIKHCYAERRVTPLNVYLQTAPPREARAAVIDYGQAIKDLAVTNLFPGDLLPKNFGVTRNSRVVFYDYDDVCLVTDCNFRRMPESKFYEDEIAAEPWFSVGPHDIFPEEFIHFLGLSPELLQAFILHHADLLDARYWNGLKQRLAEGELFHVPPYASHRRLKSRQMQSEIARSTIGHNPAMLSIVSLSQ